MAKAKLFDPASLAPLFQRWSELCRRSIADETTAALRWYLMGRADAHQMDADRARELISPTVALNPSSDGSEFVSAYDAFLGMLRAMTPRMKEGIDDEEVVVEDD